uniref:Uncharacterized protein n=1 Tax=Rhizophora mucronata TaxID=61149 RepID=A0A2P2NLX4_RHIMU
MGKDKGKELFHAQSIIFHFHQCERSIFTHKIPYFSIKLPKGPKFCINNLDQYKSRRHKHFLNQRRTH